MTCGLCLASDGWLTASAPGVRHSPSPNFDERPMPGGAVRLIVVHAISLPPDDFSGTAVERFFRNELDSSAHPYFGKIAHLHVSAHFFIRRDGEIIQFVSTAKRAWHAGASAWQGQERCNDFSIGIELEGTDSVPFEAVQYDRLNALNDVIASQSRIEAIVGHSDIAPGRKTDPGPCFEWSRVTAVRR